MKKMILFCAICLPLFSLSAQTKNLPSSHYKPFPSHKTSIDINDITTMLYKMEGTRYRYEFSYDQFGNLSQEIFTDLDDVNSSFMCSYVYDENQNMLRRNTYSWKNNGWYFSCYEDFTYNEQNQRLTRTNANDLGDGFVIGGIGYYAYDENGNLASYTQQCNMGNHYESIDSMVYRYDENNNWIGCESYNVENGAWVLYYHSDATYTANGQYDELTDYYYSDGWSPNTKYAWTYNELNNPDERNYYIPNGNGGWSSPQEKYVFRYHTDINAQNVLFPYVASIYNEWENWFGANNPINEEDWWTINLNDNQLTYIETVTYYYSPFHVGIESQNEQSVSIFPNPVENDLFIELNHADNAHAMIFDLSGKLLKQTQIQQSGAVSLSNLASGMYLVKIYTDNQLIATEKVIKK